MRLTVHRATNQIGGNCIEIASNSGSRVILDVGRPLDAPKDATGLLPASLDTSSPVDGLLISHPHQDHYGLLGETPPSWPVYSGEYAGKLMALTANIFGRAPVRDYRHWKSGVPLEIGAFTVTPYLTDHSAFDAYMLMIEGEGKRVLYSGDFRIHGRKASLVDRMMRNPPPDLDALLMEGTNLGTDKPTKSEADLEEDFVRLFRGTPGRVFVSWSAQNVDRTVTLYRACLKARRTLVVDLYTAEVLRLLADAGSIPQPGWDHIKVVITRAFRRLYARKGREDFVSEMARGGVSAAQLSSNPREWVIMVRPSLMRDYIAKGVRLSPQDAWSFSQWRGYLREKEGRELQAWFDSGGARAEHIHTSGHASVQHLQDFARSVRAKRLVPIHGIAWDEQSDGFGNVVRLLDGEPLDL